MKIEDDETAIKIAVRNLIKSTIKTSVHFLILKRFSYKCSTKCNMFIYITLRSENYERFKLKNVKKLEL